MKVIGTRARERRRDKRLSGRPISVEIDGKSYQTQDWGLGGFLVDSYEGPLLPGDCLHVRIVAGEGAHARAHVVEIIVARLDRKTGEMGGRFIDIDDDAFGTLEGWLSGRLAREMSKADG